MCVCKRSREGHLAKVMRTDAISEIVHSCLAGDGRNLDFLVLIVPSPIHQVGSGDHELGAGRPLDALLQVEDARVP